MLNISDIVKKTEEMFDHFNRHFYNNELARPAITVVFRLVCLNGMIVNDLGQRKYHVCINESGVFRLPGFNHCKAEPVKVQCIKFDPELRYM